MMEKMLITRLKHSNHSFQLNENVKETTHVDNAKKLSLSHNMKLKSNASEHKNLNDLFFLRTSFHWPVKRTLN